MIKKKMGEGDIEFPVLDALSKNAEGLTTTELKKEVKKFTKPSGENKDALKNRNDVKFDQILRNIVSHRDSSSNNMINKGLINYKDGLLSITKKGLRYLEKIKKELFKNKME